MRSPAGFGREVERESSLASEHRIPYVQIASVKLTGTITASHVGQKLVICYDLAVESRQPLGSHLTGADHKRNRCDKGLCTT